MEFKRNMLKKSKADIFGEAYKIDTVINIYEILLSRAEYLSDIVLCCLLQQSNVLGMLFDTWMKKQDSAYEELLQHVEESIVEFNSRPLIERSSYGNETDTFAQSK